MASSEIRDSTDHAALVTVAPQGEEVVLCHHLRRGHRVHLTCQDAVRLAVELLMAADAGVIEQVERRAAERFEAMCEETATENEQEIGRP